jgi:hypothetical protein
LSLMLRFSAGSDGGRKPGRISMPHAKSIGWAIYGIGFAMALMFASMLPTLPWARLFAFAALLVLAAVGFEWWWFLAWLIWRWYEACGPCSIEIDIVFSGRLEIPNVQD